MIDFTKYRPLENRIVVEMKQTEKEIGGLLVPEMSHGHENAGTVVSAGPRSSVAAGTKIIFGEYEEDNCIKQDGKKYVFLRDQDAIAAVEGDL